MAMIICYLLALVVVGAVVDLFARRTRIGTHIIAYLGDREPSIDGLRGICATSVALAHITFFIHFSAGAGWQMPATEMFCSTMGDTGVSLFFLICAYIFWGRIARSAKFADIDWLKLFGNRVRRIVPMYLVAMTAAIIVLGFAETGWRRNVPSSQLFHQLLWAYSFNFFKGDTEFNGSFLAFAGVSVAWTLKREWAYYFSLPVMSFLRMNKYWLIIMPILIISNEILFKIPYVEYFIYGSICYELSRIDRIRMYLRQPFMGALAILLVLGVTWAASILTAAHDMHGSWPALILSLAFLPIAAGNDCLKLLSLSGWRFLGASSYSIYLINIIVSSQTIKLFSGSALTAAGLYTVVAMSLMTLSICAVSTVTYLTVERPFQRPRRMMQQQAA